MSRAAVELRGLTKRFGDFVANSDVSLRVEKGAIHAIIGENGAGKSTAMKMLYGIYRPDAGEIYVDGQLWGGRGHAWKTPSDAIECGIGMVHQHFMLAGPYTALENVVLGAEPVKKGWGWLPRFLRPIDFEGARAKLVTLSEQYGLAVDWDSPIEDLPVGVQQRIEILKLLYRDAQVLILDEPTAVLTPQETAELFVHLKKLAAQGKSILIITHKLKEVMNLADHVTVLRAGKVAGDVATRDTDPERLAGMMVGRKVLLTVEAPPQPPVGDAVLEVSALSLRPDVERALGARARSESHAGLHQLQDVSFDVRAGEIVGIAGIEGNGQSELLHLLQRPAEFSSRSSGEIRILGQLVKGGRECMSAARIKDLGVGVVPEDRHHEGLLLERDLRENYLLGLQGRAPFSRRGLLSESALNAAVLKAITEYDVRPSDPNAIAGRLSGGNQQKLIIAREFERDPKFFIAAQPTRGVDVGAIEFIHKRIFKARDEGAGVLLVSSELDEILALSDRILVIYAGQIVARFVRGQAGEQELGLCMGGGAK